MSFLVSALLETCNPITANFYLLANFHLFNCRFLYFLKHILENIFYNFPVRILTQAPVTDGGHYREPKGSTWVNIPEPICLLGPLHFNYNFVELISFSCSYHHSCSGSETNLSEWGRLSMSCHPMSKERPLSLPCVPKYNTEMNTPLANSVVSCSPLIKK